MSEPNEPTPSGPTSDDDPDGLLRRRDALFEAREEQRRKREKEEARLRQEKEIARQKKLRARARRRNVKPGADYTVRRGDCLSSIGRAAGIPWQKIYHHEKNVAFREKRPNPHIIRHGDRLYIPDREIHSETVATGAHHAFILKVEKSLFRTVIKGDDGAPLGGLHYSIEVEGRAAVDGTTDSEGLLEVPIRTGDSWGMLTLQLDAEEPGGGFGRPSL